MNWEPGAARRICFLSPSGRARSTSGWARVGKFLDERKAAIYDNLRDLQFEYRVGKLSDADYQLTKKDLQKELAGVMAEVDRVKLQLQGGRAPKPKPAPAPQPQPDPLTCPHCSAHFDLELKFCGECGKPMKAVRA